MVATGIRIGIRPSLFSSGCLWFVSWHPHCSVEWCYNILTISRSRNVSSLLGYLYKITNCISSGGWNKDQHIINFHCWPTSYAFLFPSFSFGSTHTSFFSPFVPSSLIFFEMWKELLELWHELWCYICIWYGLGKKLCILKWFLIYSSLDFCMTWPQNSIFFKAKCLCYSASSMHIAWLATIQSIFLFLYISKGSYLM